MSLLDQNQPLQETRQLYFFSRIQQWFTRVRDLRMLLLSVCQIIEAVWQIVSGLHNLAQIFSTGFNWLKLDSAVSRIYSGVSTLMEEIERCRLRLCNYSITQEANDVITV